MPDDNKFQKLRDVGYTIPGLCGYCQHGNFEGPKALNGWGECTRHSYTHRKHDNPEGGRGVSIHATGTCPQFQVHPGRVVKAGLGAHTEFFQRTRKAVDRL